MLNFFTNRVINQWNSLPEYVILSNSLNLKINLDYYWNQCGYMDSLKGLWPTNLKNFS